jgi:hypothetical protein
MGNILKNELMIGLLLGLLIALILFSFFWKKPDPETITVTEQIILHKVDTVYVIKTPNPDKTSPSSEPERYDSTRFYSGRKIFDYGFFDWKIETGGYLNEFTFQPTLLIPERRTSETIIKTNYQQGFFLGGGFSSNMGIYAGASYLGKGYMVDLSYNPILNYSQLGVKIRLGKY